eukprot:TRINITY_DN3076_c0_g1_i1.p1 TRINITY_DN3076_c0_g1~~TRINITY_DN3076_c0_g1_i1.p1  ORF type:complete len:303 (-),score=-7.87 TRINITY_DN3076_c0_g1_i1:92-970(-)
MARPMLLRVVISLLFLVVLSLLIIFNIEFFLGPTWEPAECSDSRLCQGPEDRYDNSPDSNHTLAILVPFRNREMHLQAFSQLMHAFFQDLNIKFSIHVIEQDDKHIFNRAKLLNIGFNLTQSDHDYFCLHDVDTIPASPCVDYSYPNRPRQLGVLIQKFGWKYIYRGFAGTVTCVNRADFIAINGYSNDYWGWGGEDDDFSYRIKLAGLKLSYSSRPSLFYSLNAGHQSASTTFREENLEKLEESRKLWKTSGLNNLWFKLKSSAMSKDGLYYRHKVQVLPDGDNSYLDEKK